MSLQIETDTVRTDARLARRSIRAARLPGSGPGENQRVASTRRPFSRSSVVDAFDVFAGEGAFDSFDLRQTE